MMSDTTNLGNFNHDAPAAEEAACAESSSTSGSVDDFQVGHCVDEGPSPSPVAFVADDGSKSTSLSSTTCTYTTASGDAIFGAGIDFASEVNVNPNVGDRIFAEAGDMRLLSMDRAKMQISGVPHAGSSAGGGGGVDGSSSSSSSSRRSIVGDAASGSDWRKEGQQSVSSGKTRDHPSVESYPNVRERSIAIDAFYDDSTVAEREQQRAAVSLPVGEEKESKNATSSVEEGFIEDSLVGREQLAFEPGTTSTTAKQSLRQNLPLVLDENERAPSPSSSYNSSMTPRSMDPHDLVNDYKLKEHYPRNVVKSVFPRSDFGNTKFMGEGRKAPGAGGAAASGGVNAMKKQVVGAPAASSKNKSAKAEPPSSSQQPEQKGDDDEVRERFPRGSASSDDAGEEDDRSTHLRGRHAAHAKLKNVLRGHEPAASSSSAAPGNGTLEDAAILKSMFDENDEDDQEQLREFEKLSDEAKAMYLQRIKTKQYTLLQPLKDMAKAWNIDISGELDVYLKDLKFCEMQEASRFDFSRAAMLVQHAAGTHARRVDMLHDQVFKSLEQIVTRKGAGDKYKSRNYKRATAIRDGFACEFIVNMTAWLKRSTKIDLDPDEMNDHLKEATLRRVPLWLMPREEGDRKKREFKLSACTVHGSGAFCLLEQDLKHADLPLSNMEEDMYELADRLVPPPPENWELQDQMDALKMDLGVDDVNDVPFGTPPLKNDEDKKDAVSSGVKPGMTPHKTPLLDSTGKEIEKTPAMEKTPGGEHQTPGAGAAGAQSVGGAMSQVGGMTPGNMSMAGGANQSMNQSGIIGGAPGAAEASLLLGNQSMAASVAGGIGSGAGGGSTILGAANASSNIFDASVLAAQRLGIGATGTDDLPKQDSFWAFEDPYEQVSKPAPWPLGPTHYEPPPTLLMAGKKLGEEPMNGQLLPIDNSDGGPGSGAEEEAVAPIEDGGPPAEQGAAVDQEAGAGELVAQNAGAEDATSRRQMGVTAPTIDWELLQCSRFECEATAVALINQAYTSDTVDACFQQAITKEEKKKYVTLSMGHSAEYAELEDIFVIEQRERRKKQQQAKKLNKQKQAKELEEQRLKTLQAEYMKGDGSAVGGVEGQEEKGELHGGAGGGMNDASGMEGGMGDDGMGGGGGDGGGADSGVFPGGGDASMLGGGDLGGVSMLGDASMLDAGGADNSMIGGAAIGELGSIPGGPDADNFGDGEMDELMRMVQEDEVADPFIAADDPEESDDEEQEQAIVITGSSAFDTMTGKEVARLHPEFQTKILEMQRKLNENNNNYSLLVRERLDEVDGAAGEGLPELYNNVQRWNELLEPILAEENKKNEYDFAAYSKDFLDTLGAFKKETVKMSDITHNLPKYEIGRQFLTALFLTNAQNVDIIVEEATGEFQLKLLDATPNMPVLQKAAGVVPPAKEDGKKGKKAGKNRKKSEDDDADGAVDEADDGEDGDIGERETRDAVAQPAGGSSSSSSSRANSKDKEQATSKSAAGGSKMKTGKRTAVAFANAGVGGGAEDTKDQTNKSSAPKAAKGKKSTPKAKASSKTNKRNRLQLNDDGFGFSDEEAIEEDQEDDLLADDGDSKAGKPMKKSKK